MSSGIHKAPAGCVAFVLAVASLLAAPAAGAGEVTPWFYPNEAYGNSPWYEPWAAEPRYSQSPWSATPEYGYGAWSSGPGYAPQPVPIGGYGNGFEPWSPPYPGSPNPTNIRSGGDAARGLWEMAPTGFRYRRPGVTGGPKVYAHGWYTPWGDYEGVMIIRGNLHDTLGGQY